MPTFTSRLGLTLPDSTEDYDVDVHNGNMVLLDEDLGGLVMCTSVARPSTTFPGMLAFETDTGLMIIRNDTDTGWILATTATTCTSSTRPTSTHPGMLIWEVDTQCLVMRNSANSGWNARMGGQTTYQTGNDSTTVNSTTYGNGSGGTMPGITFVAPPSGEVILHYSAQLTVPGGVNNTCWYAPYVRSGAAIDLGSDVVTPNDNDAIRVGGAADMDLRLAAHRIVPSLTPGNIYNVKMKVRKFNAGGTATILAKKLIAQPV